MAKDKEEKKEGVPEEKSYSIVSAADHFRRSGILFTKIPTILTKKEITPEIKAEKMLKITEIIKEK